MGADFRNGRLTLNDLQRHVIHAARRLATSFRSVIALSFRPRIPLCTARVAILQFRPSAGTGNSTGRRSAPSSSHRWRSVSRSRPTSGRAAFHRASGISVPCWESGSRLGQRVRPRKCSRGAPFSSCFVLPLRPGFAPASGDPPRRLEGPRSIPGRAPQPAQAPYRSPVPDAPGETWSAIDFALRKGIRGLGTRLSLAKFKNQRFGRRGKIVTKAHAGH
jgi:hypothetical protein